VEGATIRATLGLIFLIGVSVTMVVRSFAGDINRTDVVLGLSLVSVAGWASP
jgi:hypothetical protein